MVFRSKAQCESKGHSLVEHWNAAAVHHRDALRVSLSTSTDCVPPLGKGLATTLVVPPNTWGVRCYQAIENEARHDRKGLWALPEYQPQQARTLPLDSRGFRIVQGQVSRLRNSRYTVWVDIDGPLVLQIAKKDLDYFDSLEALVGQQIEARGWIKQDRDEGLRMKVRHPAALRAITSALSR